MVIFRSDEGILVSIKMCCQLFNYQLREEVGGRKNGRKKLPKSSTESRARRIKLAHKVSYFD